MALSVTCECGARLEIDEKFLGKEIPCPDCQRLLPTKAPPTPPPLDLPNHRKKSALAVLSLTLALVFMFIPLGAIAAIVTGLLARQRIAKYPGKLEGVNLAWAGIIAGGVSLVLSIAAYFSPYVLVDQLLRELAFGSYITYKADADDLFKNTEAAVDRVSIQRPTDNPSRWAKWNANITNPAGVDPADLLILVNTNEDAYIACLKVPDVNADEVETRQKKILERFYKSDLLVVLAKLHGAASPPEGSNLEGKTEGDMREVFLDMRLGNVTHRFLIQFKAKEKHDVKVVVGAARRSSFERLQKDFRAAFKSMK